MGAIGLIHEDIRRTGVEGLLTNHLHLRGVGSHDIHRAVVVLVEVVHTVGADVDARQGLENLP